MRNISHLPRISTMKKNAVSKGMKLLVLVCTNVQRSAPRMSHFFKTNNKKSIKCRKESAPRMSHFFKIHNKQSIKCRKENLGLDLYLKFRRGEEFPQEEGAEYTKLR